MSYTFNMSTLLVHQHDHTESFKAGQMLMKLHAGSDVQRAAWGQKQRAEASSYANWTTLQNGKMAKFCKDFVHLEFLYNM